MRNKGALRIEVQGDQRLFNHYGVILLNPTKHPAVRTALGQRFIDYLISLEGQGDMAHYRIDGHHLFCPDASDPRA